MYTLPSDTLPSRPLPAIKQIEPISVTDAKPTSSLHWKAIRHGMAFLLGVGTFSGILWYMILDARHKRQQVMSMPKCTAPYAWALGTWACPELGLRLRFFEVKRKPWFQGQLITENQGYDFTQSIYFTYDESFLLFRQPRSTYDVSYEAETRDEYLVARDAQNPSVLLLYRLKQNPEIVFSLNATGVSSNGSRLVYPRQPEKYHELVGRFVQQSH